MTLRLSGGSLSGGSLSGRCLCGAVAFVGRTEARTAHECHCSQCRRQSGHVWAYVTLPWANLRFVQSKGLATYRHSARATRGFCSDCGAFVYWRAEGSDTVDLSAGLLDAPTGLRLGAPSYPAFHGDYYPRPDKA